jgi:hypothetical protein
METATRTVYEHQSKDIDTIPIAAEIGIAKLPAGKYRVNVQASDTTAKSTE